MNKVIVICNVEHDITPGVCAFCERDKERAVVESLRAELIRYNEQLATKDKEVERLEKRWAESTDLINEIEERAQKAEAQVAQVREALEKIKEIAHRKDLDRYGQILIIGDAAAKALAKKKVSITDAERYTNEVDRAITKE